LYEDPSRVTTTTMPHAHNEYAQLALELGVPGMILMLLFLLWWGVTGVRVWRVADSTPFARAATIASAALLVHSFVEFPLRTAALSACFAMCLALLLERRVRSGAQDSELWPTRHVVMR
jgi:O-antigen ligase